MSRLFLGAAIACLTLPACKRAAPPLYCSQDLSGVWLNSSDKHFAYQLHDDGGVVRGDFKERADDGGLAKPAEPISVELKRTGSAMAGVMRSKGTTAGGNLCPIEFETRVTDCKPEAIQVVVELSAQVGEDCKRVSPPDGGEIPSALREFRLERAPR
jgi:hypothetical protein